MSDTEEVQLPIPSRTTGSSDVGASENSRGVGGAGGSSLFLGIRSSRKFVDGGTRGLRRIGSRRLNPPSNGSKGRFDMDGSTTGGTRGDKVNGSGSKACTACGFQFTWRQRRHHCRACRKACCDPCSKDRLLIVGGDSKRHRVCYPCVRAHLATGRTRDHRILPTSSTSVMSSPFNSQNTSRNVSPSRQVPQPSLSMIALATYAEDPIERFTDDAPSGSGSVGWGMGSDDGIARAVLGGRPAQTAEAAAAAAEKAIAMAAAWTGTITGEVQKEESSAVEGAEAPPASAGPPSPSSSHAPPGRAVNTSSGPSRSPPKVRASDAVASGSRGSPVLATFKPPQVEASTGGKSLLATIFPAAGGSDPDDDPVSAPTEESWKDSDKDKKEKLDQGQELRETPNRRPPLGTGVRTDPASHQHKRPVQAAKDQNPLALPWFTGKHASPCPICEDLWRVAWSAREDFLRDLSNAEKGKDYQLVHSVGENLRLYSSGNMFWGGHAIRLRVEAEVAVPIGFAMRWLASLTARGGVYYPYSDTVACDIVEAKSSALSVACAHWPTQLSGARRCTVLRYVSEDGSPPPGMEEEISTSGKGERDPRPTIIFTTIDHPIMREWALPGVDVEVFPSGLVFEEMDSPAGPVTKVKALMGWDNKGTLQHMAKMSYMTERTDRMEGLGQHLRAMEQGYQEQSKQAGTKDDSPLSGTLKAAHGTPSAAAEKESGVLGAGTGAGTIKGNAGIKRNSPGITGDSPGSSTRDLRPGSRRYRDEEQKQQRQRGKAGVHMNGDGRAKERGDERDDDEEENFEERRERMTSRAVPLSPNRGRNLIGGDREVDDENTRVDGVGPGGLVIRRMSESGHSSRHGSVGGGSGVSGDWNPPPGHKSIPSPARAAELEAEVSFLTRKLSARQSLEERLRVAEADKARLITKLATAQADAARKIDILENRVKDMTEKLTMTQDQVVYWRISDNISARRIFKSVRIIGACNHSCHSLGMERFMRKVVAALGLIAAEPKVLNTQRRLGDAEERAMAAMRDLRLSRDALRVQADLSKAASSAAATTSKLSQSPGTSVRFPASIHDLPLAASPVLRAPPPVRWGSGPVLPGGGVVGGGGNGDSDLDGSAGGPGGGEMLVLRTQEMGVRFALDTLRYSEDEEVVVFMLHLVQGLRFEADMQAREADSAKKLKTSPGNIGGSSSSLSASNTSTVARVLFKGPSGGNGELSQLASLLIGRACENEEVANFLFWYLKLEAEACSERRSMYERIRTALTESLVKTNATFASALQAAEAYVSAISEVHAMVKQQGGRAPKKTARLKSILAERRLHVVPDPARTGIGGGSNSGRRGQRGGGRGSTKGGDRPKDIPLPLDPRTVVLGLRPATAYTFPSAMSPCVVEFVLSDSVSPSFKGDDLLLDPSLDEGPGLVTDISASLMHAWNGGPLPRQRHRSAAGTLMAMSMQLEEEDSEESSDEEDATEDSPSLKSGIANVNANSNPNAKVNGVDKSNGINRDNEHEIDLEDEEFLDRRRISADVGSAAETTILGRDHVSLRKRDMDENDIAASSAKVVEGFKKEILSSTRRKSETGTQSTVNGMNDSDKLALMRRSSTDLTKLRLWEQMQILGAASQERGSYLAIFKNGEDVRQDQLAVHMVSLMDRQLKEAGLDLRLRPYRVLATGLTTGMIEFVPGSVPMSAVLAKHNNSVLEFLRYHNADPAGPLSMKREALDNFTRSCAGSCVVTYLMGVGDRHLDNLMLLPDGILFHIDFGYLFGKDPKLMSTPFRLTKEMVEAMGGTEAPHYTVFKSLCCQAYRHLRKSAHQYLNLLSLMAGAGIKDLAEDPAAVLQLVQDRFKLDLTDEEADAHFLGLVSQSITAIAPRVMEVMHQIRVAAR